MAHVASPSFAHEKTEPAPRSDLAAVTGIMVSLAFSAAAWALIGYALRIVAG